VYAALPSDARSRTSPSRMLQSFLLESYGVATVDRNSFGRIGAQGQHFLRLSIATSLERLRDGVERIARAAVDRDGFSMFAQASS
jgi:aspartate aminotransferase